METDAVRAEGRTGQGRTGRELTQTRPKARFWVLLWLVVAAVVWNGVFDILVTRGVKEYLYRQADHELGYGPAVTMREIMDETVRDAALTASLWALFVGGAGLVTVYAVRRVGEPVHASTDL